MILTPRTPPAAPSRGCVRSQKTASGIFLYRGENRTKKTSAKSLKSRLVAKTTARKSASGVRYYGFRYYNPSTGRWLSRDPIEENGGENLYAFVSNDGINAFDPYGLEDAEADFVSKSFINGIAVLGSLKSWKYPTADINLRIFAETIGQSPAFRENPATDAKDGKYRLYTRVTIKASCCKDAAPTVTISTEMDGGQEAGPVSGTINMSSDIKMGSSSTVVHWNGWGRPALLAEPAMLMVKPRTSRNIWHDVTIIVSCEDGKPSFDQGNLRVSKFPSFRLWKDGKRIDERRQGALSDLWQADPSDSSFVAP